MKKVSQPNLDAQALADALIVQFEEIMNEVGDFQPFGTLMNRNGNLQSLAVGHEMNKIERLRITIEEKVDKEKSYFAGGFIYKSDSASQLLYMNIKSKNSGGWIS